MPLAVRLRGSLDRSFRERTHATNTWNERLPSSPGPLLLGFRVVHEAIDSGRTQVASAADRPAGRPGCRVAADLFLLALAGSGQEAVWGVCGRWLSHFGGVGIGGRGRVVCDIGAAWLRGIRRPCGDFRRRGGF